MDAFVLLSCKSRGFNAPPDEIREMRGTSAHVSSSAAHLQHATCCVQVRGLDVFASGATAAALCAPSAEQARPSGVHTPDSRWNSACFIHGKTSTMSSCF